jgi:mannose-6-phosphate isomerase-like protein (cupin superfamily)
MTSPTVAITATDPTHRTAGCQTPRDATDLAGLVAAVAANPSHWQAAVRFGADERWWTRLHRDELTDVWLLTWVNDTGTDLHDHGRSAGAFIVVVGELEEVRPDGPGHELVTTTLHAGDVRRIERGVVHDVRSPSRFPAVSIHAYSPPLREMTFFEQHPSGPRPTRTVTTQAEGTLV